MSQEPLNSNNSWESEELTEAELDALAGGRVRSLASIQLQTSDFFSNSTALELVKTDSIFTSYVGAPGTTGLEGITRPPLNLSLAFP